MNKTKALIERMAGTLQFVLSNVILAGALVSCFFIRLMTLFFIITVILNIVLIFLSYSILRRYDKNNLTLPVTARSNRNENIKNVTIIILELAFSTFLIINYPIQYVLNTGIRKIWMVLIDYSILIFVTFIVLFFSMSFFLNVAALCMKHTKAS